MQLPPALDLSSLSLFGPPTLRADGAQTVFAAERPFQLLVVLALRAGRWVTRDELAALFWPGHTATDARRNLRNLLFKARAVANLHGLEANEQALRWAIATDVRAFEDALAAGRLDEAIALGADEPLQGLDGGAGDVFAEWVGTERRRLVALWQRAAGECLEAPCTPPTRRRALAEALLARDPCDEAAVAVLMSLDLEAGHAAAAERRYRDFALRLAEQLGLEPSSRLRGLLGAAAGTAGDAAFVGRRSERRALAALLTAPGPRAVAIVGPGGAGKSALARRALADVAAPSLWIELQDLDHEDAVIARLAHALEAASGVSPARADRLARIARALAARVRLLALDNAETVPGLARLIEDLLAAAPALVVLVTSRIRPGVAGETVVPLGGLDVPDEDSRDAQAAGAYDAVRLFEARASAVQHGFRAAAHIDAVVDIVERVGGLPLAIELAASWVRLLPPATIATDLRQALDLLERDPGSPLAMARAEHASMRGVLERSWALLAPSERGVMQDLSVFQGGFAHPAAREVAQAGVALLSSLVDKSMLRIDEAGRFGMHPLVAALAQARAAADPARRAVTADRHAAYLARSLEDLAARPGADHRPLLQFLQVEMGNAQLAWRHALASGRSDWLARMLPAWRRHVVATGRFFEGSRLIVPLLEAAGPALSPAVVAQARAALAWFAKCSEDAPRAIAIATDLLASPAAAADPRLRLDCLNTLGAATLLQAERAQARHWFAQSLALAEALGQRAEVASALNNLALAHLGDGDFETCRPLFARAAALQRELGDHVSLTRTLHNLAAAHMGGGDWAAAQQANDEALRYALAHDVGALVPVLEFMQGATLIELDRLAEADRLLASAERHCAERRLDAYGFKAGYYRARLALRRDEGQGAAFGALLAWFRRAQAEGRGYDLLYLAAFVGEGLARRGAERAAARLFRLAERAPLADVYLRATVDACRRRMPDAGASTEAGASPDADGAPAPVWALIAACRDADELQRLLAAPTA